MSAAELRSAAALIRERAEAATGGPWERTVDDHGCKGMDVGVWSQSAGHYPIESLVVGNRNHMADAQHIASWHPAVALAFADLLDDLADVDTVRRPSLVQASALKAARAYMGGDS